MKKIKEIIVVEGVHDTQRLQQYFECDTIETSGQGINEEILERIEQAQKVRGVIVFTDPDTPGEQIRRTISARIPGIRHAFIDRNKAKTPKKVGVEHAAKKDLEEALAHCVTFEENAHTLEWSEFLDLGLVGDAARRQKICDLFHIGHCNAKTCYKRLNQLKVTADSIRKAVETDD